MQLIRCVYITKSSFSPDCEFLVTVWMRLHFHPASRPFQLCIKLLFPVGACAVFISCRETNMNLGASGQGGVSRERVFQLCLRQNGNKARHVPPIATRPQYTACIYSDLTDLTLKFEGYWDVTPPRWVNMFADVSKGNICSKLSSTK